MGRARKPMKKIREILRLKELGISDRKIAMIVGVSRKTVSDYLESIRSQELNTDKIKDLSDSDLFDLLGYSNEAKSSKYQVLRESFPKWQRELTKVGVTLHLLWEEYRKDHTNGYSRSQFCYHFSKWRSDNKISMHIEHKAGDKMYVDYAGHTVLLKGTDKDSDNEAKLFIAILGASQLTFVCAVGSQNKEDFILANRKSLEYFGGVPKAIVPDCLKSAVTKASKYEPEINLDYDDFAEYYNTVVLPARPYKPKDKALVENAVRLTYQRILAPLRNEIFHSIEELNNAIAPLLEKHNSTIMKQYNASRRDLFNEIEKNQLRPLPLAPYEIRKTKIAKVAYNYHVYLGDDKHHYSVPFRYLGQSAKIRYNHNSIAIFIDNVRVAVHTRSSHQGKYTTIPEHMPPDHRWRDNWNPETMKQWASNYGSSVEAMIEKILLRAKHPEQAFKTCMGILNIPRKEYSKDDLNLACKRALHFGQYSHNAIQNILKNNLQHQPLESEPELFPTLPDHENIRGGSYYQLEESK